MRVNKLAKNSSKPLCINTIMLIALLLSSCSSKHIPEASQGHLGLEKKPEPITSQKPSIPEPVKTAVPALPIPSPKPKLDTYTVIVNEVPLRELLFALARDAKLNLDIYDNIEGSITLNAVDQTLPQILDRIGKQSNIRYQIEKNNLAISADTPYLKIYKVAYVNLERTSIGQVDVSTQIAASGTVDVGGNSSGGVGSNNSTLTVNNSSEHNFWQTLFINIASIIGDDTSIGGSPSGQLAGDALVINREAGLVSVRATSKQHKAIQGFIDSVISSTQKQVLIEATVVEVNLSNNYQAGVDWNRLATNISDGFSIDQQLLGSNLNSAPTLILTYADQEDDFNVSASVRLLEEFGNVKVLSSPKIMALNNQTSVLKVVDNRVYFTIEVETTTNQTTSVTNFETDVHTVPVGLVMSLVPFISDNNEIILNIRPTISRILQFVNDPNPLLADAGVISQIPEIQVREMESMLRLNNGQLAVIGGLMQDSITKDTDAVPGISKVPGIGEAFKYKNNQFNKTELIIFLRTTVIEEPSLDGDLVRFKEFLPSPSQITSKP